MLYINHNRRSRQSGAQRGASLIEVLVALILLVVGIYSIARLFPGGFFSLRSAQNSDEADRLAQGQLEKLKQDNNFLVDAVYMYSNEVGFFSDTPKVSPTAAGTYTPAGGTVADATLADINKARYISGEMFTVGAPNTANTATNGVSIHVLNDGPAVLIPAKSPQPATLAEPGAAPATPSPAVEAPVGVYGLPPAHSGPWAAKIGVAPQGTYDPNSQVPGSYDLPTDLLSSGQPNYAIDYGNEEVALPSAVYDQHFTLEIKLAYPASGTGATATPAETVTEYVPLLLPASTAATTPYQGTWFDPLTTTAALDMTRPIVTDIKPPANGTPTWVTGSAVLTRTLTQVQDVATLKTSYTDPTTDPYTYALYSSDAALKGLSLGVLAFNPRLQGQTVSVSYLTYDWHIIREDEDVPSTTANLGTPGTQSPIHLTIDHLKRVGDVQDDQSINPGLFRAADLSSGSPGYDIVLLDTDTGDSIGLTAPASGTTGASVFDLDNANGNTSTAGQFAVSYQNGYVTLPSGIGTTIPSTTPWAANQHQHVRIFYSGDYNWAVALQKNPSLYVRNDAGLSPATAMPLPKYSLKTSQYAIDPTGNIYFSRSDSGQSVALTDISYQDTAGNQYQISSLTLAISDSASTAYPDDVLDSPSSAIRMGGDTQESLANSLPVNNAASPVQVNSIKIGAVQGISARSVVVWKERGQWKSRSVSTILNQ